MKRAVFISLVLASGFSAGLSAQAQQPPDSRQARKLAEQVLAGREVIVRLYHEPKNKPRAFDRLTVKLDGVYVKNDAVRLAFAASKTADDVDVSFEQLLASGQAAKTTLDRLVKSAQVIQSTFEQVEKSVKLIEQATGRKFVDPSDFIDGYARGRAIPSTWSLPGSIADSASAAGSAIEQMMWSAQGNILLDRMLEAGKTFQAAAPTIDLWAKNLGLRLASAVHFAEAVETKLDLSAENAGQVQTAIDRIVRLGQESASTLEQIAKDGESVRAASQPIELSVRAVERALDKMLEQKTLVVTGEDQSDEAVAEVVGEFVHGQYYRAGSLSIWPSKLAPPRYPWCLFQDADKQPVAGAGVEVMIGRGLWDDGLWLWIRHAKLDEQGRLKAPSPGSGVFDKFMFKVHYPDFGAVPVGPHAMELPNEPHRIYTVPMLPKDKWCVFKDALGNPMPHATVEVFRDTGWRKESRCWATATLDEKGRLRPPRDDPRLEYSCFIVSHPDYGTALVEPRRVIRTEGPLASFTVPLGRIGTEADQRSIWGRVEDANGNGVSRAIIRCRSLDIPGGGHISLFSPYGSCAFRTITDQNGLFALLAPLGANGSSRPAPPGAQYAIEITAPKELGLQAYEGSLQAGEETIITLQPADPNYLPAFIFYDEFGPVTEPGMLAAIHIKVRKPEGSIWSPSTYDHWLNLIRRFVPGIYYAAVDWSGKHYVFEPVDLTKQRPDTVVFKPQKIISATDILFRGKIVHGVTGEPIAGAMVLTPPSRLMAHQRDPEAEQWQDMVPVYPEVSLDETKLALLKDICDTAGLKIVQTDQNGRYQISLAAQGISAGARLVAIKKSFLGAQQQLSFLAIDSQCQADPARRLEFEPDQTGCVPVPPMKLFPAGTIIVEPNVPVATDPIKPKVRLKLHWFKFPGEKPRWLKDFGDYYPVKNEGSSLWYKGHLRPNQANRVYVVAGVEMNIEIHWLEQYQSAPLVIPGVKLQQGQIVDLGKWEFGPTIKVAVKVVDPQGKPVEGVNVRQTKTGLYWGQQAITNHQGVAIFRAPLYSEGEFVVGCFGESLPSPLTERTGYQVADENDAGKEFTLQLSDEMLQQLFE